MFSPLNVSAMRAMWMRRSAERRDRPAPRRSYVPDGIALHGNGKRVPVKREIRADRSAYTGEVLREIAKENGSGKGLRQLAIRAARRAARPTKPEWMRASVPDPEKKDAA